MRNTRAIELVFAFLILRVTGVCVEPLYALDRVSTAKVELDLKLLEMTMKEKTEWEEEAEDDECDYALCEMGRMNSGWTKQASKKNTDIKHVQRIEVESRRKGRLGSFGPIFVSIGAHP